jgi:hypothetical protein
MKQIFFLNFAYQQRKLLKWQTLIYILMFCGFIFDETYDVSASQQTKCRPKKNCFINQIQFCNQKQKKMI